jgi:WD40 repeat protein
MSKTNIPQRDDRQDLHNTIESFQILQLSSTWNANLPSSKNKPPRTSNRFLSSVKQCFGRGNIPQEGQDRNLDLPDIRVEAAVILKIIYLKITLMLPAIGDDGNSRNFWLWNILSYLCDENRAVSLGFREENHHCVTPFLKFNDQLICNIVEKETSQESYLAVDELDDAGKLIQRYRRDIRGKAYSSIKLNENLIVTSGVNEYDAAGYHFRDNFLMTTNPNTGTASRYENGDDESKEVVENLVRLNNNQIISWKENSQKMFLWNFSENPNDPFNILNAVLNGQQANPAIELTMATAYDNSILRLAHRAFYHLIWYNRLEIKSIVRLTDSKFAIASRSEIIIAEMDDRSKYIEHYQRLRSARPIKLLIGLDENMVASTSRSGQPFFGLGETITVWDLNSGKCRILRGHTGRISTLFKLNDTTIVSGGSDHTLRVWDLKNKTSRVLKGHEGTIGSVKKVNDNMIISQSCDSTLRVWDLTKDTSRVLDRTLPVFDCALPMNDVIITSKMVKDGVFKNRELLKTHTLVHRQSVFKQKTD